MKRRTDVEITDLGDGIIRINEYGISNFYLIAGEDRTCLIDAGCGIADTASVVRSLTDRQPTVLLTHSHADHIGGAVFFDKVYMHPAELSWSRGAILPVSRAYLIATRPGSRKKYSLSYLEPYKKRGRPGIDFLSDGDEFDLGGRVIRAVVTPGHSAGGVTFIDSLTGDLFTGDNVNPLVTLRFKGATSVAEWLDGAKETLGLAGSGRMHPGHGRRDLTAEDLMTLIEMGERIAAGGDGTSRKVIETRSDDGRLRIVYKGNRVLRQ